MIGVAPVLVVVMSFLVIEDRQGQSVVGRMSRRLKAKKKTSEGYPALDANDEEAEAAGARAKSELLLRNAQSSEPGAAIYETQDVAPASPAASSSEAAAASQPPPQKPSPPALAHASSPDTPDVAAREPSSNAPRGREDEGGHIGIS